MMHQVLTHNEVEKGGGAPGGAPNTLHYVFYVVFVTWKVVCTKITHRSDSRTSPLFTNLILNEVEFT